MFNVFPKFKTLGKNKDKFCNFVNAMIPFKCFLGTNGDCHFVSHVCFVFSFKKNWAKSNYKKPIELHCFIKKPQQRKKTNQ